MEYKLFDTPKYNNIEFYKDIEMTDHINQFNHSLRLYISIAYILWVAKFNNIKQSVILVVVMEGLSSFCLIIYLI